MMNLQQMGEAIASKIGLPDSETAALIQQYLARRYQMLWQSAPWRDACTLYTIEVEAGTSYLVLPDEAETALAAAWDQAGLLPGSEAIALSDRAQALLEQGQPAELMDVGRVGLAGDPQGGQITLTSNDVQDTDVQATLIGHKSGIEVREVVTLTGTNAITPAASFDLVRALSKTVSRGTITVRRAADSVVLGVLGPKDVEKQHVRIRLLPPADKDGTLMLLAKRRCHPLRDPADVPVLRGASLALEAFAHGDALEWMRQYAKAQAKFAEAMALLEHAKRDDAWQPMRSQQILPVDGVGNPSPFASTRMSKAYW